MVHLEQIRQDYEDLASFLIVYVKEAHPDDEWSMALNGKQGVTFNQPKSLDERLQVARAFVDSMNVETRVLVDNMENTANACYAAWPERIYVVETGGTIGYKGGIGPYFFEPEELREYLEKRFSPAG